MHKLVLYMENTNILEQNNFHKYWVPSMLTLLWLAGLAFAFDGIALDCKCLSKFPRVWLDVFPIFVLMAFSVIVLINDILRTYPKQAFTNKSIHYLYVLFLVIFILAIICMVILSVFPDFHFGIILVIIFGGVMQFLYNYVPNNLDKYLALYDIPVEADEDSYIESPMEDLENNG